ncbi:MAG: hypothetical protein CVU00_09240 [Bacteroidetes bacterium HGW-Bacteroidetes-17]|nr:MAG: hypothetical protein CVU00_09240 [Bacteroidetes bacterium HGW-Bacteroidetes-17]
MFENYSVSSYSNVLKIEFEFSVSDKIHFYPKLTFPIRDINLRNSLSEIDLRNLVFHIGMIELLSYWKATCSPLILIKPHIINSEQVLWWKKLYFEGLGEFFHLNEILTDFNSFVEIKSISEDLLSVQNFDLTDKVLVPIGGGKDSIVSMELLKSSNMELSPLVLNMTAAQERTIQTAGFDPSETIEIKRGIDPKLLELNGQGYLNGHTPFSALLAFTSLLAAVINGYKHIALSNESSANESTIAGSNVNHQYSKSYEFESDFRNYVRKYISRDLNYFSFLRPLNELQIAALFSKFSKYFPVFRSCNVGSKKDEWCGKCPKCLFTNIILSPFLTETELHLIFGKNLLADKALLPIFEELIGIGTTKPFECVGTLDDVNAALVLTTAKHQESKLPFLLEYYLKTAAFASNKNLNTNKLLTEINSEHFLSSSFFSILKSKLK